MAVKKFTFGKVVEPIEIGDKKYEIDFSDVAVEKREEVLIKWQQEYAEFVVVDIEKLDINDQRLKLSNLRESMRSYVEAILGENTFDDLYEMSGKSTVNLLELVNFLTEFIAEKSNKTADAVRSKYVKK